MYALPFDFQLLEQRWQDLVNWGWPRVVIDQKKQGVVPIGSRKACRTWAATSLGVATLRGLATASRLSAGTLISILARP